MFSNNLPAVKVGLCWRKQAIWADGRRRSSVTLSDCSGAQRFMSGRSVHHLLTLFAWQTSWLPPVYEQRLASVTFAALLSSYVSPWCRKSPATARFTYQCSYEMWHKSFACHLHYLYAPVKMLILCCCALLHNTFLIVTEHAGIIREWFENKCQTYVKIREQRIFYYSFFSGF